MTVHRAASPTVRPRPLHFEKLEGRDLPAATVLALDFTPDNHAGGLADTFSQVRNPGSRFAPAFLDFDRNGVVNSRDVTLAADQVAARVQSFFAQAGSGLNVAVRYGDVLSNSGFGAQVLAQGRRSTNELVQVMYVGGTNRRGASILGMAPEAPAGMNVEGFAETYSRALAQYMAYNRRVTSAQFVDSLAQTIAHEFGHMLGLRHPTRDRADNIMSAYQPANPGVTRFLSESVATAGGAQNAFAELRNSFVGQRSIGGIANLGGQASHWGGELDHRECDFDALLSESQSAATLIDEATADAAFSEYGVMTEDGAVAAVSAALANHAAWSPVAPPSDVPANFDPSSRDDRPADVPSAAFAAASSDGLLSPRALARTSLSSRFRSASLGDLAK